jgi:hypothetical protein
MSFHGSPMRVSVRDSVLICTWLKTEIFWVQSFWLGLKNLGKPKELKLIASSGFDFLLVFQISQMGCEKTIIGKKPIYEGKISIETMTILHYKSK